MVTLGLGCTMPNPAFDDGIDEQGDGSDSPEVGSEAAASEAATSEAEGASVSSSDAGSEGTSGEGTSGEGTSGGEGMDSGEGSAGSETGSACGELVECFGICTDTDFDDFNCGECGEVCLPGSSCIGGTCMGADIKLAFVSSQPHSGAFDEGLAGADVLCNELAQAAGLPGFYLAWLSNEGNWPAIFYMPGSAYVRPDGVEIAASLDQLLDGDLDAPLDVNELGVEQAAIDMPGCPNVSGPVWSNTDIYGAALMGGSCGGWTTNDGTAFGLIGDMHATDEAWTAADCAVPCDFALPIYCIEP